MATWTTIADSVLEIGKPIRSIDAFALRDNITAAFEKAASAPVLANSYVVTAMITDANVTQGKLANSSVGQAQLKTTTGEVSVTTAVSLLTLPGGTYGFYPQLRAQFAGGGVVQATIGGIDTSGLSTASWGTTYVTIILLGTTSATVYAQQRYVQASPPYDLGDGVVPTFVFAMLDASGKVLATYAAADPPWANNGPTNIRADGYDRQGRAFQLRRVTAIKLSDVRADPSRLDEYLAELAAKKPQPVLLTPEMKNADMGQIPHPFLGNDLTGRTVVMLDPCCPMMSKLAALSADGESVAELLSGGYVRLDNSPLERRMPPGVVAVTPQWRLTR
jgi:hypothetical protein